jgi:hypothetical protein
MKFRNLVGLAAIGGLIYAHKRRGGVMTIESFKQSAHDLLEGTKSRAQELRSRAESRLHATAGKVAEATDVSPRGEGTAGYEYGKR